MIDVDAMLNRYRAARKKYVNDEGGVESNNGIHCPFCGHFHDDCIHEMGDVYTEDDTPVSCEECGKDFVVTTRIEYTFISTRPD